jgi:adenylosuccinate lyase
MIGVLDVRHYARNPAMLEGLGPYFSEEAFYAYLLRVEAALAASLAKHGICSEKIAAEIEAATLQIRAADVHAERHALAGLLNCIKARVSDEAKPFVHFTATTNDTVNSADACRYKEFTRRVLLPKLVQLERTLIEIARREKDSAQVGRTHGMHAEPITFGFALALFVSRLGRMILRVEGAADDLRGKMSGNVGAYNATAALIADPEAFERDVLAGLGLEPSHISTQVVEPEFLLDYAHALVATFGILANIADDMRHLHRSEIGEVEELPAGAKARPQKLNPTGFEHVKSLWKVFMPRMVTVYSDQISEHQRDLTNFESTMFVSEIAGGLFVAANLLDTTLKGMVVRRDRMEQNLKAATVDLTPGIPSRKAAQVCDYWDSEMKRLQLKAAS